MDQFNQSYAQGKNPVTGANLAINGGGPQQLGGTLGPGTAQQRPDVRVDSRTQRCHRAAVTR